MTEAGQGQPEDVVAEWLYLSDRAQQIYGGLVGLSDFGHWDTYFARTFDIYTRLWRFQQQHRTTLESKDSYGLQRWEIGDIATRIAQLYYHYYLRTSDGSYLQEAYLFYDAVRTRNYYKAVGDRGKSSVMALQVKQLRFYARFIATCLLLDRRGMVLTLVEELSNLINEYATTVKGGGETQEWHLVLQEITLFLQADVTMGFKGVDVKPPPRRTIFPPRPAPLLRPDQIGQTLKLQSCILVGCHQHQVKFSELTLDMYRMMYFLEREPPATPSTSITVTTAASKTEEGQSHGQSASAQSSSQASQSQHSQQPHHHHHHQQASQGQPSGMTASSSAAQVPMLATPRSSKSKWGVYNPKKYLLYRPTVSQVLHYLASAHRELHDNGVLLLYVSADGEEAKSSDVLSSTTTPVNSVNSSVPPVSPASSSNANSSGSIPPSPMNNIIMLGSIISSTSSLPGLSVSFGGSSQMQTGSSEQYSLGGVKLKDESKMPILSSSPYISGASLFPGDLTPFTRRPTFIIVDSDSSHSFLTLGVTFGAPLLVLVSPQVTSADILESSQAGSLFTFYLHDPLSAFLFTSNKTISSPSVYEQASAKVRDIASALDELFTNTSDLPIVVTQFIYDEFMRLLLLRYCFCHYVLKLRSPKDASTDYLPASYPQLPPTILGNSSIVTMVKELAAILGVANLYF